ncbi:SurA N-terminal domain-containing protein [uncultured Phenylobacterium sp.]|uniref:peptidylprolyl isomerase n=1 Tax=uncultured Phenylobacterium sp. TaxID=349273 RepID=UPI0025F1E563|nr:SurA N-terminal domain-containing protein [uncultured Phenylobacterium sp.]
MLAAIRNFAKSWPARILLALLAISFVGWGVTNTGTSAIQGDEVIKAGSRVVDSASFRRQYENYKKAIEEEQGQPIPADVADANRLDQIVLNGLATREAFAELLSKVGVRPSDKLVLAQIQKIPAFFDPVTGRFDKITFERMLGQNNMTPKMLDADIRDRAAALDWSAALQNGLAVPRAYGALGSVFALETRDLAYFLVTPQSVPQPPKPTDAQLQAFINQNRTRYTLPEMRQVTMVVFSPESVGASLGPIDPAELKKRYDFRKDTLSRPESRTIVQIPAKDAASAQAIVQRLRRGEPAEAIAKSQGVAAITFTDKPRTAIADRKAGEAAFKLQAGEIAAVQGDLGLSVVQIVSVVPGREVTIEEARPMLEAEIRKDMLAQKTYAQSTAFDDARSGGASLADAAKQVGITPIQLPPLSAEGVDALGRQLQGGFPPKILQTAFTLPAGGESETTELDDGVSFAVRVEKVIPAHLPPLEQLRPVATVDLMRRDLIQALEARAEALAARIRKGETLDAVAASAGYAPVRTAALSRQTASAHPEIPREVLGRAFGSKPGEVWTARAPNALAVGRIDNVQMESGPAAAQLAEQGRGELTAAVFNEMREAAQTYARAKLKVKTDADRARAAAGFEPIPKDKAKTAEKKG